MQEFLQPLLPEEERHYLILSRQGDMNARNLLVEHNLRLVAHIVKKYHNLDREKEDMISIGVIGLIKAINTYDISKGHRLVTYAARCIENVLLMMLRQEKKTSKNTSLYEPIGIDKEGNEIHLLDILGTQETDLIIKIEEPNTSDSCTGSEGNCSMKESKSPNLYNMNDSIHDTK